MYSTTAERLFDRNEKSEILTASLNKPKINYLDSYFVRIYQTKLNTARKIHTQTSRLLYAIIISLTDAYTSPENWPYINSSQTSSKQ
jgi:hypothetical protein